MPDSQYLKDRYICPAKINLGLEVLFKRDDGYHELNTVFARVKAPQDIIEVTPADEFTLTCTDASLPLDDSNLVLKAVKAFAAMSGRPDAPKLHLHLIKQIPSGAGLGGGSSDAAQALHICNDFFARSLAAADLLEVASWVGADVPFFVSGYKAAIAGGIGERLEEFDLRNRYGLLIVKPEAISIPTKDAYSKLSVTKKRATDIQDSILTHQWGDLANDFEPVIFAKNPHLEELKLQMQEQGAFYAAMSGSGSAIYGLFDNREKAIAASTTFANQGLPFWVSILGED